VIAHVHVEVIIRNLLCKKPEVAIRLRFLRLLGSLLRALLGFLKTADV